MASTATYEATPSGLSASEHSRQLRKAVIASTIGTTIEWYDFFIYGTAAGLIFGKLYFPNEDPLTATLAAFGTYFIGFASRPIGAAIFRPLWGPHWPQGHTDRHPAVHGYSDLPDSLCADLRLDRHLGCRHLDPHAYGPGHRRRWGVGRFSPSGDGMVASSWSARVGGILAAIRRPGWSVPCEPIDLGLQRFVGRSVRHLGVASSFRAFNHIVHAGAGGARNRAISDRMSANICRGTATSMASSRVSASWTTLRGRTSSLNTAGRRGASTVLVHWRPTWSDALWVAKQKDWQAYNRLLSQDFVWVARPIPIGVNVLRS
jgi:hypothetical protein